MPNSETRAILDSLLAQAGRAILPLQGLDSPTRVTALLHDLGYQVPESTTFTATLPSLVQAATALSESVRRLGDAETDEERLSAILALTAQMGELGAAILEAVQELEDVAQSIPGFLTATRIAETLPLRLCDYLLVSYARRFQPRAYSVLNLIGIMELEPHAACPDIFQPTFELAVIHWDRLSMLFTNPRALVNSVYQWETDFDSVKFLARLAVLMRAFTIPGGLYPQAPDKCKRLGLADDSVELRLPIAQGGRWPDSWGEFGVAVSESGEGPGLAVAPYVFGSAELSFDLTPNLELELAVSASLDDGLAIVLRPPFDFDFVQGFAEDEVGSIPDFSLQLNLQQKESAPELFLLGSAASSRFTLAGISITSFVSQTGGNIDLGFGAGIRALRLVIVPSEGDDFLQKLLSIDRLEAEIGLALSWSLQQGFEFSSEAQLELTIPLHISILDVIELDSIYINLAASEQGLGLRLGVSGSAQLGPFAASVNRIGIRADMDLLDLGSNDGNLGGADLSMGFLPPTGIGLSLDAVGIVGGGFIDFYEKDGRYSGVLSLVCGDIGLVAIGLITTRMPDGTDGFSMFVSITATFNPPIELSYGFTLSGVGGLIGVNRSMSTAELRKGIKTGAIDSIMFPEPRTVIANAANIIRNMRSVFPVAEGQYVIGPMLKLGWGSPVNIMVVDLGIFIEIGISGSGFEVARVVLMGQAEMALPRPEAKTIEVNIDILGILDLERKEASFQAAIEASSLMAYKMCGDCACLVSWGGRPDMALAIGGFHPKFTPPQPPSIFADLRRMSLVVNYGPLIELGCTGYLAVTPNSLQFGAQVHVFVGISELDVGIKGYLGFDALFIFSPFSFEFSVCAGMTITAMDITLTEIPVQFTLSGPRPWNVYGKAVFKILFWDVDANFNETWGESRPATRPLIDPWDEFKDALAAPGGWGASLPPRWTMVESLASLEEDVDLYLFSWDEIPGNDNGKLIEFLKQKFEIDWVKTAEIEKIDNGNTIKVYTEINHLLLNLNQEKTEVIFIIDDGRTDKFMAKMENGKLNIYVDSILVVHPVSTLELRQNVLPLNINLEKFGNASITGHDRFEITAVTSGGSADLHSEFLKEYFARAQFENLGDKALSIPSFEKMDAGITTSSSTAVRLGVGDTVDFEESVADYDSSILLKDGTSEPAPKRGSSDWIAARVLTEEYARTRAHRRRGTGNRFLDTIRDRFTAARGSSSFQPLTPSTGSGRAPSPAAVNVSQDGYRVVNASDLTTATLDPSVGSMYLFSWDEIPGNDNGKLIEFLKHKFKIDWVKTAEIEKIDNGNTIKVYTEINHLLLNINQEKTEVIFKIDDGRTDKFMAKMENGKLKIYGSINRGLTKVGADQVRLAQLALDPSRDLIVVAEHEITDYGDIT